MTRADFIEQVTTFDELKDFCYEHDLSNCDDVIDSYYIDDYIYDDIRNYEGSWEELRNCLDEIPTGYGWYWREGTFDYYGIDNDFDYYKEEVLNEMDEYGCWDDDDEEEEPIRYTANIDETPIAEEPIPLSEFMKPTPIQVISDEKTKIETAEVELEAFIGIKATIKGGN